jgi:hypothetical protein
LSDEDKRNLDSVFEWIARESSINAEFEMSE